MHAGGESSFEQLQFSPNCSELLICIYGQKELSIHSSIQEQNLFKQAHRVGLFLFCNTGSFTHMYVILWCYNQETRFPFKDPYKMEIKHHAMFTDENQTRQETWWLTELYLRSL